MSATSPASRVRLHVEDSGGNGRPVLLIHGWPLSAESWKAQVGPLREAGHRVIAYDRRGFGRSDKPDSGYDYDTLTGDLAELLEEHDLREATLVGFSMGGGEVARYVGRHGEARLRSVVFAAAVPPCLMKSADNPDGPLTQAGAAGAWQPQVQEAPGQDWQAQDDGAVVVFIRVSPWDQERWGRGRDCPRRKVSAGSRLGS